MKTRYIIIISSLSIILILSSCVTQKKLTYLQNMGKLDNSIIQVNDAGILVTPYAYKLMPYDNLSIRVVTPDPQWSQIFNAGSASGGGGATEESAILFGYPIDGNGYIELPFAGKLKVTGKTLSEIKVKLDSTYKNYVKDASITVRLVNNYISLIGEVSRPGRYPITRDRLNIFEALSLAGDLTLYSKRHKIKIIRQSPNGPIVKEFSLLDRNILTSEFYYVMPNDIIYSEPLNARTFQINSSTFSLILSSIVTILSSITTWFVIFKL